MTLQNTIFFAFVFLPFIGAIIGGIIGYIRANKGKNFLFFSTKKKDKFLFLLFGLLFGGVLSTILLIIISEILKIYII